MLMETPSSSLRFPYKLTKLKHSSWYKTSDKHHQQVKKPQEGKPSWPHSEQKKNQKDRQQPVKPPPYRGKLFTQISLELSQSTSASYLLQHQEKKERTPSPKARPRASTISSAHVIQDVHVTSDQTSRRYTTTASKSRSLTQDDDDDDYVLMQPSTVHAVDTLPSPSISSENNTYITMSRQASLTATTSADNHIYYNQHRSNLNSSLPNLYVEIDLVRKPKFPFYEEIDFIPPPKEKTSSSRVTLNNSSASNPSSPLMRHASLVPSANSCSSIEASPLMRHASLVPSANSCSSIDNKISLRKERAVSTPGSPFGQKKVRPRGMVFCGRDMKEVLEGPPVN
jgi:hypothetical protein